VIDVGDDCDVADLFAERHRGRLATPDPAQHLDDRGDRF
jgi:hypothetical protein